jgi:hypothetical protein
MLWADQRDSLLVCSLAALALCLVPSVLTFLWANWGLQQAPDQQLAAVLGGTGVRMFFVLGVGLLLSTTVPYLREYQLTFWLWVLLYYLATLALEIVLLMWAQAAAPKANQTGSPTPPPR